MSKFRPLILLAVATLSAVIAYGLWSRPSVEKADSDNFSAERVVRDIEVISKKHHSVAHPAERAEVRDYLVSRLENLGADTVELFEYKNLVGPQNKHVIYTFDAIDNIMLQDGQVGRVALHRADKTPWLSLSFNAPVVGIWSPPTKNAPFICLEPWYGRCDRAGYEGDYRDKDWVNRLAPGERFSSVYTIEIA